MLKRDIRKIYIEKRKEISPDIRSHIHQLISNWNISTPSTYLSYLPLTSKNELSPISLEEKWASAKLKCYPRVISATEMIAIPVDSATELMSNKWGILEPPLQEAFPANQIDAVIIPLLAFDKKGYRVGYGKGFYDRFLSHCKPDILKIGISAFPPIERIQDIDNYDVPLNYCITPEKIYEF